MKNPFKRKFEENPFTPNERPKLRIAKTVYPDRVYSKNEVFLNAHEELVKMNNEQLLVAEIQSMKNSN